MSEALQEARKYKNHIEAELSKRLQTFTAETGLGVLDIDIERIDLTALSDTSPKYMYRVKLDIRVDP